MDIKIYNDTNCEYLKNTKIPFTDKSNIVSINNYIIGFFNIHNWNDSILLDYELVRFYQGKHLGQILLNIAEEYIKEKFKTNKILLLIRYDNISSEKIAINNGYQIDSELVEQISIDGEMTMYYPYYKNVKRKVLN